MDRIDTMIYKFKKENPSFSSKAKGLLDVIVKFYKIIKEKSSEKADK